MPKKRVDPDAIRAVYKRLKAFHSDAHCELDHKNAFELVVATVLSAQSTDVAVNKITPDLFAKYPTPELMAKATQDEMEGTISRIGMFRMKSRSLLGLSKLLVEKHAGQVPQTLAELIALPGVGRKTANVVLGVAFGKSEGVVVYTHVQRISQRLGWTKETEPIEIEQDLMKVIPKKDWDKVSHVLIFHGRIVCFARKPDCEKCPVNDACPSAFDAENVGRKPARPPRSVQAAKAVAKKTKKS
ncbi:MAG: endonuclease III [Polyangiaceae bacterium]